MAAETWLVPCAGSLNCAQRACDCLVIHKATISGRLRLSIYSSSHCDCLIGVASPRAGKPPSMGCRIYWLPWRSRHPPAWFVGVQCRPRCSVGLCVPFRVVACIASQAWRKRDARSPVGDIFFCVTGNFSALSSGRLGDACRLVHLALDGWHRHCFGMWSSSSCSCVSQRTSCDRVALSIQSANLGYRFRRNTVWGSA